MSAVKVPIALVEDQPGLRAEIGFHLALAGYAVAELPHWQPWHHATGAAHGAAFCNADGDILLAREDVGRHNALDKLVGRLSRTGRLGEAGFVVLSSRGSHELVRKCAKVGIAALATISAPTAMGVQMAELIGLRFWGLCRPPQAVLYAPGAQSA